MRTNEVFKIHYPLFHTIYTPNCNNLIAPSLPFRLKTELHLSDYRKATDYTADAKLFFKTCPLVPSNWFCYQQNSPRTDCILLFRITRSFWASILKEKVVLKHSKELLFQNFCVNCTLPCYWYLQILIMEC